MAPVKQLFIFCLLTTAAVTSTTMTSMTDSTMSAATQYTSDAATVTSDAATVTSDPATVTSDATTVTSDAATVISDPATVTSVPATVTSDPATVTSDAATITSDSATVTSVQVTGTSDAVTGTSNPVTGTSDPVTGTSDPATVTTDPVTGMSATTPGTLVPTSPSTPATTTAIATTIGPCGSNPCPRDSRCEEVYDGFRCLCRQGLFYDVNVNFCILGKIFPSELTVNTTFKPEMKDNKSEVFKTAADEIVTALNNIFEGQQGYMGSTVYSIRKGSVLADVENFFLASSEVNDALVNGLLTNATNESGGLFTGFAPRTTSCKEYCDERTTVCETIDGLATCTCKAEYVISTTTEQFCVACPSGEKAVNSETCEACDFGYSGFNCDEYYLLAVVIISCALGALLIAALVAVIVLSCRGSKKSTQFSDDSGAFGDMNFHKSVGIPRIPRANHNSDWEPANLETSDSGSTRALVTKDQPENIAMEKYYDPYDYDTRGNRSQTPSRNGYGNRNEYGNGYGSRGTRNPYYDPDEDRI